MSSGVSRCSLGFLAEQSGINLETDNVYLEVRKLYNISIDNQDWMGEVYTANDKKDKFPEATKIILKELFLKNDICLMFYRKSK